MLPAKSQVMDRELSSAFIRKRRLKIYGFSFLAVLAIGTSFFAFRNLIYPRIERSKITIATAETGVIEATIPASGLVIPEREFQITSPINAKIEQVLKHAGERVAMGESILQLNKDATLMAYDKLLDEQQVNRNKISQLKLDQERTLGELQTEMEIKEVRIQSLETAADHQRALLKVGGGTEERVKQAMLDLDIAKLELRQLKTQLGSQGKSGSLDIRSLDIQVGIQAKNIQETNDKLNLAEVRSPGNGIVTSVSDQIGSDVHEGTEIARIADLSSFKVEGSIADAYAPQLKSGGQVIVRINETDLRGHITTIQPAVENGTVKFMISLDKRDHRLLRSNLKVDVFIVTSVKDQVVRVKNGPVFTGSASQFLFVLNGKEAVKRKVTVGESNFDYTEIRSGLNPGDQVILTDLPDFNGLEKFDVGN